MSDQFKDYFKGKKILVAGGTGSIGSEIVRQLIQYEPKHIRIFSRDESKQFFLQQELNENPMLRFLIGDIRDKDRLRLAVKDIDIIFHTAALKHVPFCEYNPFEAIKTNVYGTQNLVDVALEQNVKKVIGISTDKAVYPNTIMGITKLLMERILIGAREYAGQDTSFTVVRFGNVLNSRGSVIPHWIKQIKKGGPVTITDKKMRRFFMSIPDAIHLVFSACVKSTGSEIFILKMKEYSIYELAQEIIKKHSKGRDIKILFTGLREREKLKEELYTGEEARSIKDSGEFYIIEPKKHS